MRFLSRAGLIVAGLLLFIISFLIGASLTRTTPELILFASGINRWEYQPREQSMLISSDGQELDRLGYKRIYSQDFPELLKQAVVAVEDRRFYQHAGLDTRGIGRAIWNDLKAGSKEEGGSTITQQLARTLFLSQEKTITRKLKEVFVATALEEKYGKDAILNMYLNEIYMGRGCSGIATAARYYFGKDVYSLNQSEICLLTGMIQAPEFYSPERNFEGLKTRQETVINVLAEQGIISTAEVDPLKSNALNIKEYEPEGQNYPYITAYVTPELEEILGEQALYQGGLKIYLTLDSRMQKAAERAVKNQVASFSYRGISAGDAALVAVDPRSGMIKAMVGGVNFDKNQFNMAVQPRQPGSAIKPLYYAAAIDLGIITPDTTLNNKARDFGGYFPHNYSWAPEKTTTRQALINSYNVASVEILNRLGVEEACRYLENFGISSITEKDKNLALGLGGMSQGISPLQMAAAFGAFADKGRYHQPFCIERIEDPSGDIIYSGETTSRRVLNSNTVVLMEAMLRDVVRYGTGSSAAIAVKSGGKTGTTTDSHDLWYVGYIQEMVTAVWVGNTDGKAVSGYGTYGGTVSAPIWRNYMNSLYYAYILEEKPVQQYVEEEETSVEEEPLLQEEEADPDDSAENTKTTEQVQESEPTPSGEPSSPEAETEASPGEVLPPETEPLQEEEPTSNQPSSDSEVQVIL